jgi:hypothetical protein
MATIVPRSYWGWGDATGIGDPIVEALESIKKSQLQRREVAQQNRALELLQAFTETQQRPTGRNLVGPSLGESAAGQGGPRPGLFDESDRMAAMAQELFDSGEARSVYDATAVGGGPGGGSLAGDPYLVNQMVIPPRPGYSPEEIEALAASRPPPSPRREPIERVPVIGPEIESRTVTRTPSLASRLFEPGRSVQDRRALLAYGPAIEKVRTGAIESERETTRQTQLREGLARYRQNPTLEGFQTHVFPHLKEEALSGAFGQMTAGAKEERLEKADEIKQARQDEATAIIRRQADAMRADHPGLAAQLEVMAVTDPRSASALARSYEGMAKNQRLDEARTEAERLAAEIEAGGDKELAQALRIAALSGKSYEALKVTIERAKELGRTKRSEARIASTEQLAAQRAALQREIAQATQQAIAGRHDRDVMAKLAGQHRAYLGGLQRAIAEEKKGLEMAVLMKDQTAAQGHRAAITALESQGQESQAEWDRLAGLAEKGGTSRATEAPPAVAPGPTGPADRKSPAGPGPTTSAPSGPSIRAGANPPPARYGVPEARVEYQRLKSLGLSPADAEAAMRDAGW